MKGKTRWTICALLFFATTINYIDRQVLGILAPTLQKDLGWSEVDYASVVSWFTLAYALGYLGGKTIAVHGECSASGNFVQFGNGHK